MNKYIKRFIASLVRPKSEDHEQRNREYILNILLVAGLLLMVFFVFVLFFIAIPVFHHYYIIKNLPGIAVAILFLWILLALSKRGYFHYSALLLVGCFFFMATFLAARYGILLPQSVLLYALTIVMAGILLSSRVSFFVTVLASFSIIAVVTLHASGFASEDLNWLKIPASIGDAIGISATLFFITTVSWLMYREMQRSLLRAERSERKLREQQDQLEIKVQERTRELQIAQAEKLSQLNKFAELGYTTTALFHDLANRITVLAMDVETLGKKHGSEELVNQTNESIQYIEDMVRQVRLQVQGHEAPKDFEMVEEIEDIIEALTYKTRRRKVEVQLVSNIPRDTRYFGERIGFRQIVGNFINNAIGAYEDPKPSDKSSDRVVVVTIDQTKDNYTFAVADQGRGISNADLKKIFEPFFTTKKQGMGIGLFISKLMAERQFNATLTVESEQGKGSTFTLVLPRKKTGGKRASPTS